MNFFDHKDLGNHLLQLCPKVVKHPVYIPRQQQSQSLAGLRRVWSLTAPSLSMNASLCSHFTLMCRAIWVRALKWVQEPYYMPNDSQLKAQLNRLLITRSRIQSTVVTEIHYITEVLYCSFHALWRQSHNTRQTKHTIRERDPIWVKKEQKFVDKNCRADLRTFYNNNTQIFHIYIHA